MKTLRFLIVEDHEFQRLMLRHALLTLGAEIIHTARNGLEAMRILRDRSTPVDIVITDLMMPDVDGIELIPMLRQSANAVSVVLSSTDDVALLAASEVAKGCGVPVLGVVAKPITPAALRPLLEKYVAAGSAPGAGITPAR